MLYLVPTPIGHIKDMTVRGIEVLQEVDLILSEDTRKSGILLKHYEISTKQRSYHAHNEHRTVEEIVKLLESGLDIALISDAGSPGISDPGYLLIHACQKADIPVTALPGPTAFVPALTASGIPSSRFYFEGFLPHKKGRQTRWIYLTTLEDTIILYESPHRLQKCLGEIATHFGPEHIICVARELTKMHEEIKTCSVTEMIQHYEEKPSIKGEIVIIIAPKK